MKPGRRKLLTLFLLFSACSVMAQKTEPDAVSERRNTIKMNLSALIIRNISVQYERHLGLKTSLCLNLHYIPMNSVPFASRIRKVIQDAPIELDKLRIGNAGFTPEFRYYLGRKRGKRIFYLGPFVNFNRYTMDLPITYSGSSTGIFKGTINAVTAGLQLGAQWKLGGHFYLDWWILGPNFGGATGDLNFTGALSPSEQTDLTSQLDKVSSDVPIGVINSYSVNANGANVNVKGPWGGLRGLGFNIGYRF